MRIIRWHTVDDGKAGVGGRAVTRIDQSLDTGGEDDAATFL